MKIVDQDKTYVIEDGIVVTASVTKEQKTTTEKPIGLNDPVKVGRKTGKVMGIVPTIYGDSHSVQFEDGDVANYTAEQLQRAEEMQRVAVSDNPAEALIAEYDEYNELPIDNLEDVEAKRELARSLNLRAKALSTDRKIAFSHQLSLDSIVTATAVDLMDLEKERDLQREAESQDYMNALPRYQVAEQFNSGSAGFGDDISYVALEETESFDISDAELAGRASQMVARVDHENLSDDTFFNEVKEFAHEYLPDDVDTHKKFDAYAHEARTAKLAKPKISKTASVSSTDMRGESFDLDNTPVESLYYSE